MQRFNSIASSINFFLCILLVFLSLFYTKISMPSWMMPFGRMHAVVLHLPIGMFAVYLMFTAFKRSIQREDYNKIQSTLLNVASTTALISALFGMFLSVEKGSYQIDEIFWHKMSGIMFVLSLYTLAAFYDKISNKLKDIITALTLVLLFVVGHKGAEITHGQDYLFPNKIVEKKIIDANASTYEKHIYPIFEAKCISCHNTQKTKGDLLMTDTLAFKKGGKNGAIIVAGNIEKSTLIKYINLPLDDKLHMAPKGKRQLNQDEKDLLTEWVRSGASFSTKDHDYPDDAPLKKLFSKNNAPAITEKTYAFEAADPQLLKELTTSYRTVSPMNYGSPAVQVNYILASGFDPKTIADLKKIKQQLIHLSLSGMPILDNHMSALSDFESLERLFLNNTKITSLRGLSKLINLEQLSIINTKIAKEEDLNLKAFPNLKKLFIAGTSINKNEIEQLQKKYPSIYFDSGYKTDEVLKLTPPILENENIILDVNEDLKLKHHINGVKVRYTLDGRDVDSTSQMYTTPIKIDSTVKVQARAFAPGWTPSDSIVFTIFKKGLKIDDVSLDTKPLPKNIGNGVSNLTDGKRASRTNNLDVLWLGYQTPFQATFTFEQKPTIKKIIVCHSTNVYSYIMPPREVLVYGGNDKSNMKLVTKLAYPALKETELNIPNYKVISIPKTTYKHYRIIATPELKLPSWHPGKGDKGWIFIDEVLFY